MVIKKTGQAGTVESNDILIQIAPGEVGEGVNIELTSPVLQQYGHQIRLIIEDTLHQQGIRDAKVYANDKGALDCTIRARVLAAIARASDMEQT